MKSLKTLIITSLAAGGLFTGLLIASAQEAPHHTTNSVHHATNNVHHSTSPGKTGKPAAPATPHHSSTNQPAAHN